MIRRDVLLTAFEPFAGDEINPSLEIALRLEGTMIAGHRVRGQVLPVAFDATREVLQQALRADDFELVIGLGQAGGRAALSIERVAINLIDARIADNAGAQPIDLPVIEDAAAAYFTDLPIKAMQQAMTARGVPTTLSFSAGSFVCNQVFYLLMHELQSMQSSARAGFIHVPWLPQQAATRLDAASMALDTMVEGIRVAIECALHTATDLFIPGGTTH